MIRKENFKEVLSKLKFDEIRENYFSKYFENFDCKMEVDFVNEKLIYPEDKGLIVNDKTTSNFSAPENFVVFECVYKLLNQGYGPKNIELEKEWQLGHTGKSGKADVFVCDNSGNSYLIIECKTAGTEYKKAVKILESDSKNQLFSYLQQATSTKFLALYESDFVDNNVVSNYYLINVSDNEELLKNNPNLNSYKDATTHFEKYYVWVNTYSKDYSTLGLFEDNQAFDIGKKKFSIDDLKIVSSKDIAGKYHEFATILRQHNVSGRENAFDKLVNLFLCKVVDEKNNPNDLSFYWKGKAYDNAFDLQDRLQKLYSIGMKKFLGEDITYIDNSQIDKAFRVFKDKPNATKEVIKDYFKQLKFFTNNDFAFIDIHNEKLFYQNFEVFLKIIKSFQDIRLTGGEENQFLGDMFEGFLDQGVKQSEGQFFTPMPIVKFVINSLPDLKNPLAIDYACGAGHFLNEYASQNPGAQVVGIEKEYRLSKVSKVSAFMYGNDDVKIIYDDALATNNEIKNNSFDVLVANPPYSVKGFLETLSYEDRQKYSLLENITEKQYSSNNAIECFFIEKANHILKDGGVAGIIVPSSILNKSNKVYSKTREIILKNFHIIAIYESGSGTFGKTGTNTVTLFLKKKESNPTFADHFENMVNIWFEGDLETNENELKSSELLQKYCNYMEYDFEEYKSFLQNNVETSIYRVSQNNNEDTINGCLYETEIFKEYKTAFEKENSTKTFKNTKNFKVLSKNEQEKELLKEFIKYAKNIEKDKILYFGIANDNQNQVLIIKTPAGNNEIKKFLGYEWSSGKGNEGIKYLTSQKVNIEDEEDELDEEDKRVLENISSLNNIETPLYNPKDLDDESKINTLIKKNFENKSFEIPENLAEFVKTSKLVEMLDFKRVTFDKAISLNPNKKVEIESKFELVKLGDICDIKIGGTPSRQNNQYFEGNNLWVSISEMNGGIINDTKEKITEEAISKSNVKLIKAGTTLLSFKLSIGKTAIAGKDLYTNEAIAGLCLENEEKLLNKYLFSLFDSKVINLEKNSLNAFGTSLNSAFLKTDVKIPLPPLEIQKEIVTECEKVDEEVKKAENEIFESKKEIEKIIGSVEGEMVKLGEIAEIIAGQSPESKFYNENKNGLPFYQGKKDFGDNFLENPRIWTSNITKESIKGDILMSVRAPVGDVNLNPFDKICIGRGLGAIRVYEKYDSMYVFIFIKSNKRLFTGNKGMAFDSITTGNLKDTKIPLPPLEIQKEIVSQIEKIEQKIEKNKMILETGKDRKKEVLKKYL